MWLLTVGFLPRFGTVGKLRHPKKELRVEVLRLHVEGIS